MDRGKLLTIFRELFRPPVKMPPWLWAEKKVTKIPYSPIPGPFKSANSMQCREPMEAMVDPARKEVAILACIQACKSLGAELILCYIIENLPGPTIWLSETDDAAKDHSESRLQLLFKACPAVARLLPIDKNKMRNAYIEFVNGMPLWILGAHSIKNLQRRSIRWLIGDECWNWPEGHMEEAEGRTTAFGWLGKCIWMSQAGYQDTEWFRKWASSTQHDWTFQCPVCGARQVYDWKQVEWGKDCKNARGKYDFKKVRASTFYTCEASGCRIDDTAVNRRKMAETGTFIQTNFDAAGDVAGYHWNALATMEWGRLAVIYLRAKAAAKKGDTGPLEKFYQKRLAIFWSEDLEDFGADVPTQAYNAGEVWEKEGSINAQMEIVESSNPSAVVPLRFLTVDVQTDHFWLVVRSWATNGQSRKISSQKVLTWEEIEEVQEKFGVFKSLVFVDSGHNAYEVYKQCGPRGWTALKGDQKPSFPHYRTRADGSKEKTLRFYSPVQNHQAGGIHCRGHHFSANGMRDILHNLRLLKIGDEHMWQVPAEDAQTEEGKEYLNQLEAERRVKDGNKWVWKQIGKRDNHFFDCEVMQVTAAIMLKIIGEESVDTDSPDDE